MQVKRWSGVFAVAVLLLAASCRNDERNVTGAYGSSVLQGVVVMADGSSVSGVEISVGGTGQRAQLDASGAFFFNDVPEQATLRFQRSDGISAELAASAGAPLTVTLSATSATAGANNGRRRSATGPKLEQTIGPITAVTETSITIEGSTAPVTAEFIPTTQVRRGGTQLTPADLSVGDVVRLISIEKAGVNQALQIFIEGGSEKGETAELQGPVTAVGTGSITVNGTTVNISSSTLIRKRGRVIALSEVKVGDVVDVKGTRVDATTVDATRINVEGGETEFVELSGAVTAVGTASITVGSTTVDVDSGTEIRKRGKSIPLSDVEVGDLVEVKGTEVDATTVLAVRINVQNSK